MITESMMDKVFGCRTGQMLVFISDENRYFRCVSLRESFLDHIESPATNPSV